MIGEIIGLLLLIATLPGTVEIILLTLGALWSSPQLISSSTSSFQPKIVVIVPAYNEAQGITKTLKSLQACPDPFTLVVVADNCTDQTEQLAAACKAKVLRRQDSTHRGKHFALQFAFNYLLQEEFDIFLIIDADSIVGPNLIEEVIRSFKGNVQAVQVKYALKHPYHSYRNRLLNIAFCAFNYLRPRGRQYWGLSAGVLGNGFALTKQTLLTVPFQEQSVVEDAAYHIRLVKAGYRVIFTEKTAVYAEMPSSKQGFTTQRTRWEGGRIRLLFTEFFPLLKGILKGNFRLIEPLLDLLLLPLGYHTVLLILMLFLPLFPLAKILVGIGLIAVILHTFTAILLSRGGWRDYVALLYTPIYMIQKLGIICKVFRGALNNEWRRTPRDK